MIGVETVGGAFYSSPRVSLCPALDYARGGFMDAVRAARMGHRCVGRTDQDGFKGLVTLECCHRVKGPSLSLGAPESYDNRGLGHSFSSLGNKPQGFAT